MVLRKHFHNLLKLLSEPLSGFELAEAGCLPPVLHISNIASLMYPDSENLQKGFQTILKSLINKEILPVITVEEYVNLSIEQERQGDTKNYLESIPEGHLPPMTATALAHGEEDLLPSDAELNPEQWRMFLIRRDDFKKWLKIEGEWPLPNENRLSRWWADTLYSKNVDTSRVDAPVFAENIFKKEGQMWTLRFDGVKTHLRNLKGLQYISYLLGSPYQEYHIAELVRAAGDPSKKFLSVSSGEVSTKKTIANYRKKLKDLLAELAEAKRTNDSLLEQELLREKKMVEKEIKKALGIGGRLKKNPYETSRQANAVSEAITRSMRAIEENHPSLWKHLSNTINRGEYLSYTPEKQISWIT
jgi:hypothetical protein